MSPSVISAALRQRVAELAGFRCGYCLTSQRIIGPLLEIDYIVPAARGGTSDAGNLWLACPMCNSHMNHPDMIAARRLWVLAGWHPPLD